MKATELRTGNIIYDPVPQKSITVNPEIISYIHRQETGENINPFGYSPIPLTEQWLTDFGFTELYLIGEIWYFSSKKHNDLPCSKLEIWTTKKDKGFKARGLSDFSLKYVHQLQNLYFALTGEELKRKT